MEPGTKLGPYEITEQLGAGRILRPALLLLLLAIALPADAQDIFISKKVRSFNFNPHAAVSAKGDALVTWTELDLSDSTYSQIWAALLKKTKNGFKLRAARRVSDLGTYNTNARPVWSERDKQFLIVWDTRRVPNQPSSILGRAAKKNGKPTGKVIEIIAGGEENFGPVLSVPEDKTAALELYFLRAINTGRPSEAAFFFAGGGWTRSERPQTF